MNGAEAEKYQQLPRNQKLERQKRVQENFDLEKELLYYVTQFIPDINDIRKEFINAVKDKTDKTTLRSLAHEIDVKINYLKPKYRDTENQLDYIAKLELTYQKLLELMEK